ncbi:oligosaccharide repeat unit polymerase [Nocardioides aurantiacus]|uniref:Oligosaccharide repeat unit polymerase n=1 Tax=Nocardioides aurantiacus TaxID=86796 RepID=A0A3N2CSL6_9ACTN|nr:oligosaccharide repeat unit polymerase [Nocardioides aurantiacus]ROR90505.1 hypothetical protein EDD33_1345 [Nocardioides aurantiacus]
MTRGGDKLLGDRGATTLVTQRAGPGVAGLVALVSGLAVLLPLWLTTTVPDVGRSDAWRITLVVMAVYGGRLAFICCANRPRLFDFFFCLFVYLFLGLAPSVQIRSDQISGTTPGMDPVLDRPATYIVVAGLLAYEVGRSAAVVRSRAVPPTARGTARTRARPVPARDTAPHPARTYLLYAAGLVFLAFFVSRIGPGTLIASRDAASEATSAAFPDPSVNAIISALAVYPLLIGTGALVQLRIRSREPTRRAWLAAVALVGVALLLVSNNPVSTARYGFGIVAFAIAVYLGAARTPARARALGLGTIAAFLFLFPLADAFRRADQTASFARAGFFGEYRANPDYDAFWQIANSYAYWHDGLVEPLRQITGSLLFWVPRSIWADKPTDTGILLAQYRNYSVENLSAPMWAEGMINLGPAGVLIVFVLLGYWLQRMDIRLADRLHLGDVWGIVGAVFPVFLTILLRGSLLQATGGLVVAIACVLFVRRWSAR